MKSYNMHGWESQKEKRENEGQEIFEEMLVKKFPRQWETSNHIFVKIYKHEAKWTQGKHTWAHHSPTVNNVNKGKIVNRVTDS